MRTEKTGPVHAQLPLDLTHAPALEREDLLTSASNILAIEMVDAWPNWPGPFLALVGPEGSGKSHLARIWAARSGAETVALGELQADLPPPSKCLVIEDALPGEIPEQALFHVLNHVRSEGGSCVITSRYLPAVWGVSLPDLGSRLRATQLAQIGEPDDTLLRAVMLKLFSDRQVVPPPGVVDFILARMERSLGAARRIVAEIDREVLSRGGRITRSIAAGVLERSEKPTPGFET
jgi:chromosomal replication initiation ATPase DnaA